MSRACWSFGPDRLARALTVFPSVPQQLERTGVVVSEAAMLGEFHVERAKHEDPLFARALEREAARYVRELETDLGGRVLAQNETVLLWEGDDA